MKLLTLFAHAGEEHADSAESLAHTISPWYITLPLFLLLLATVGYITWVLSKKNLGTTLMVLSGVMLISGIALYEISPLISALSIIGGIVIAGFLALASLSTPEK